MKFLRLELAPSHFLMKFQVLIVTQKHLVRDRITRPFSWYHES